MNANKIADELKACVDDGSTDLVCVEQAAQIIRQQADRIAELEKQTKPLSDEEIGEIYWNLYADDWTEEDIKFARAIEERHGIK